MLAASPVQAIDREYTLQELLSGIDLKCLGQELEILLGEGVFMIAADGALLLGSYPEEDADKIPLMWDLEPVGYIGAPRATSHVLRAAARLVQLIMHSGARYHLASNMHLIAIRADYEALQEKHAALMASEARYKGLTEHLEERVRAQVETIALTQRELYQAEKLASVGQLAAGVAHEINNPLGFIRSNLNSARSYVEEVKKLAMVLEEAEDLTVVRTFWAGHDLNELLQDFTNLLEESMTGADRVARIVADLKAFSNVDQAHREVTDVNEIIRAACNVIGPQLGEHIELELDLGRLPPSLCASGHLGQVLFNLIRNAHQSISGRGRIAIHSMAIGDTLEIRIRDTGCGISESILPRIFEPFFTTRDVGQGAGLGLSIASDIVKAHGGRIEVKSEVGLGSTVTVYLPVRS